MLLELLVSERHEWDRGRAFSALLAVSDEEPEVLTALTAAITAPEAQSVPMYRLAELKKFKQRARVFLPALEQVIRQTRDRDIRCGIEPVVQTTGSSPPRDIRYAIEPVVRAMELPPARELELITRMSPPVSGARCLP